MEKIKLSDDQKYVVDQILNWYKHKPSQYITFGGFAGTGKTTLIAVLRQKLHKKHKNISVAFVAFTGKAADVLKKKLRESDSLQKKDTVSTIHSLIYTPIEDEKGRITGWDKKEEIKADLIIIDEASMVNESIWLDLLSYNIPIIAVGDHGQLPPVKGSFNLMEYPELTLEKIHRQAADNPIINISVNVRENGQIPFGNFNGKVQKFKRYNENTKAEIDSILSGFTNDLMVLCGTNKTRVSMNNHIRSLLNRGEDPEPGDRVICLRNNQKKGIYNGMLGEILDIDDKDSRWYKAEIKMDSGIVYEGLIFKEQFNNPQSLNFTEDRLKSVKGDLFDYGYCITVHKSQGSQSRDVILIEENFYRNDFDSFKKWLYTGVTRAEETLYILG